MPIPLSHLFHAREHVEDGAEFTALERRVCLPAVERDIARAELEQLAGELFLGLDVLLVLLARDLVERRLSQVDVAVLDQVVHLPVDKGEQQGADMGAVHVSVSHDNYLVVAHLGHVAILLADAGADGGDQRAYLAVVEDLVNAGLLHVQDLAAQGQDGLEHAVAALLGRAAGAVALDDVQFALGRVPLRAVGQFPGQGAALQGALAAREVAGLARGGAGPGSHDCLVDHAARHGRVLLQEGAQLLVDDGLDDALHLAVAQLGLGLALELGTGELDADDARDALANVFAGHAFLVALDQGVGAGVGVDRARQG